MIQGVFFNWPPPEFAKCRLVSNQFEKNVRVQDWPPLCDWKNLKCLDWPPLEKLKSLDWEGTGSLLRFFSVWGGQSEDLHWHYGVPKKTIFLILLIAPNQWC